MHTLCVFCDLAPNDFSRDEYPTFVVVVKMQSVISDAIYLEYRIYSKYSGVTVPHCLLNKRPTVHKSDDDNGY